MHSKKLAVFISGGGSNFKSLIDNIEDINADIVLCISDKNAKGLTHAQKANIPYFVTQDYDYIIKLLEEYEVDFIVLAGYLKILPKEVIDKYQNKIINIHPSLIPSFSGMGYYGIKVHRAAIQRGVKLSGATTHFVNEKADEGPIIMQESVAVEVSDTEETLAKKVLEIEHKIIVKTVKLLCEDRLQVEKNKVIIK